MPAPERRRRLTAFVVAMAVLIATPLAVVASNAFTDVADSNVHHDDITWLRDNGVTFGCNPPANDQFCPDEPVLRQQMASFMRRLAENRVVHAATAVNAEDAEMLDGKAANTYQTVVAAASCSLNSSGTATSCGPNSDGTIPDQTTIELVRLNLTAPSSGTLVLDAFVLATTTNWVTLDASCAAYTSGDFAPIFAQILNGMLFGSETGASANTAVQVGAGNHTLRICSVHEVADGTGSVLTGSLTAEWTAGGSVELQGVADDGGSGLNLPLLGG